MNKNRIRFTFEFNTRSWEIWKDDKELLRVAMENPDGILWTDIELAFRKGGSKFITFEPGFRFGCEVKHGNEYIAEERFPPEGRNLISTDQDVMQHIRVETFIPEEKYVIRVWCVVDDETYTKELNFTCPGYALN